ncbi:MAG: hypothetical protein IJV37_01410 [Bacteroidales bacterium]|nr:hypothetical protein [Bacteroidales bacterium]
MKKLILFLAACTLVATGCKGGSNTASAKTSGTGAAPAAAQTKAGDAPEGFTFDELFRIFSCFGSNIMTPKYAAQGTKDAIKEELKQSYDGYSEFIGPCNHLNHSFFDGDCHDGFAMACYRFKADGHVLVILLENGGCDVSANKYVRTYEYDPATGNAHEVQFPLNPAPVPDDFEDLVRLAGADVQSLRGAAKAGLYNYIFSREALQIQLNDPHDFSEQSYRGDLIVEYAWNGAEFVKKTDRIRPCIHPDGFANILLGEPAPDFYFDYDPVGYGVNYSQGGDLWLINRGEQMVLEIQMENKKVYSIEVKSPEYCITQAGYDVREERPRVGGRINDCLTIGPEAPQVWMLMDGTISIEDMMWNTHVAFRTSQDALAEPVKPADDRIRIERPKFRSDARIESILIWKD